MSILLWASTSADVAGGYLSLLFYNTVNVYLETALYVESNLWAQIYTWSVFKCSSDSKRVGVLLKYLTFLHLNILRELERLKRRYKETREKQFRNYSSAKPIIE